MSAAIAMAPSPAPHEKSAFPPTDLPPPSAPSSSSTAQRTAVGSPNNATTGNASTAEGKAESAVNMPSTSKLSPTGPPRSSSGGLRIIVKKEPGSPKGLPTSTKPRPRKLDLSKNTRGGNSGSGSNLNHPGSARPLTSRDGLGIQEVGLACLSPGFVTQDPVMKEQVQRSLSVREQQRNIIEARLHQQSGKGDDREHSSMQFAAKTPGMSRRNRAPPGLSIVAPSHEHFASERVIQSAPLGQSFTGLHNQVPLSRHLAHQPSGLSRTSHIHQSPVPQSDNRLPPIIDVLKHNGASVSQSDNNGPPTNWFQDPPTSRGPLTSPSRPSAPPSVAAPPQQPHHHHHHHHHHQQTVSSARPREYKSAEEAQHEIAGGRPELLPKLVHYGGHQPPTPPSPAPGSRVSDANLQSHSHSSRRRTRAEYEDGHTPPLGHGPTGDRRGPFGAGRDSPEAQRAKREEFLRLCERAWDLFHS